MKLATFVLFLVPTLSFATAFPNPTGYKTKIKENMAAFDSCYQESLKTNPSLKGKVTLAWDIGDDGSVKTATAKKSTLKDPATENCMIEKLKAIRFSPANASTVMSVNHQFIFPSKKQM